MAVGRLEDGLSSVEQEQVSVGSQDKVPMRGSSAFSKDMAVSMS